MHLICAIRLMISLERAFEFAICFLTADALLLLLVRNPMMVLLKKRVWKINGHNLREKGRLIGHHHHHAGRLRKT